MSASPSHAPTDREPRALDALSRPGARPGARRAVLLALALLAAGCAGRPKLLLDASVDGGSEVRWLSGDSLLAVALLGRGVSIVGAADGEERATWRSPTIPAYARRGLATSRFGDTLAVATEDSVRVLRAHDAAPLFAAPGGGVALALSADGRTLAWSDGTVGRVLDVASGEVEAEQRMFVGRNGLAWSPWTGSFAWTDDHSVLFLGPEGDILRDLGPFQDGRPAQLAFSAQGATLAVAESTQAVSFWDMGGRRERWRLRLAGPARFDRMALSPDLWYLALAREGRARIVWAYTGRRVAEWSPHAGGAVRDLAFSHDGRRLATVGADGHVRVWLVPPPGKRRP